MGFEPGTKEFVNETGFYIQATLIVRSGNDPEKLPPYKTVSFDMEKGQKLVKQYGDRNNPNLNEISVKATIDGGIKRAGKLVVAKGSEVDIEFNTRETVIFRHEGHDLHWYDVSNRREIRESGRNLIVVAEVVVLGNSRTLDISIFDDHGRLVAGGWGGYLVGAKSDVYWALNQKLDQLRGDPGAFYPPPRPHKLTGSQEDQIMTTVASLLNYGGYTKRKLTLELAPIASFRGLADEPSRFEFTMLDDD